MTSDIEEVGYCDSRNEKGRVEKEAIGVYVKCIYELLYVKIK